MSINELKDIIGQYHDPYLGMKWGEAKVIQAVKNEPAGMVVTVALGYPSQSIQSSITAEVNALTNQQLQIEFNPKIISHVGKSGIQGLPNIKNIIAVGSGKGGVGKSTVAVNLALALQQEGASVGLLDADIYGPSQPAMLGVGAEKPEVINQRFQPIIRHGLQTMSIGYLISEKTPMVWRGPMLGKALQQLLQDSDWRDLDYLVIDLPPGTGDVQLTLCQKIPVTGALLVTTPQDLALLDVRRAIEMFLKLEVPVLGVVENMSGFACTACGHQHDIFGKGGGANLCQEYDVPLFLQIPLHLSIREQTDAGHPTVVADPDSDDAARFRELARKTAGKLATRAKDYSARFPKIVTQ